MVKRILVHVESTKKPAHNPLPVLAEEVLDGEDVADAFDAAISPAELLEPAEDSAERQEIERWADNCVISILSAKANRFTAEIKFAGRVLGTADFEVDLARLPDVKILVSKAQPRWGNNEELEVVLKRSIRSGWLKIWFDSGHTVTNRTLFRTQFRDVPFDGFHWADFTGYNVDQEKPDDLSEIGKHQSLFCWTAKTWPKHDIHGLSAGGWLACDDGAGEVADFIHFDDRDRKGPPLLTLIHIKGAHSAKPNRDISVSAYEVVCAQAIKNLRFLQASLAGEALESGIGKKIGDAVWCNCKRSTREKLLRQLVKFGTNMRRRVVVLQPHVTKAAHTTARSKPDSANGKRLKQLNTLLLETRSGCASFGADFTVVAAV